MTPRPPPSVLNKDMPVEYTCCHPGCNHQTPILFNLRRHEIATKPHCYTGMAFKITCNGPSGCQKQFFTKAFLKEDIESFLRPDTPKTILCIKCKIQQAPKRPAKRKRSARDLVMKMVEATEQHELHPGLIGPVPIKEVLEYFKTRPDSYFDGLDTAGIMLCKSPVGLVELYTSDDNGGGTGVDPHVRAFWRLATNLSAFFAILAPGCHNSFAGVYRQYLGLYGRGEGLKPVTFDEFVTQSLAIKRMGKPLLKRRGEDNFVCGDT